MDKQDYTFYNDLGCGYIRKFLERNPEFDNKEFLEFINKNRGDRDSGELQDVAKHEILHLAYEWIEHKWRFPHCYNRKEEWNN